MSRVIAASGPYAAELSASRPSIGMPAIGPTRCSPSSCEASGLPSSRFLSDTEPSSRPLAENAAHAVQRLLPVRPFHVRRELRQRDRDNLPVVQTVDAALPCRVEPQGVDQIDVG